MQGDFREHIAILKRLDAIPIEVRTKGDLDEAEALIIPGGESTTISKLIKKYRLGQEIKKRNRAGMPIYGTCAGAIVLAKEIIGYKDQATLGIIDVSIDRNAYGRQIDSFEAPISISGLKKKFNAIFIRAPIIKRMGDDIEVLARHDQEPVLIRQRNILIGTFHPELTEDPRVHELFLYMVKAG